MITIGGSGYRKHQPGIDKRSLYSKDPIETMCHLLINRREKIGEEHFGDPKTFTEFSNNLKDVYLNIDECNQGEKSKILIVFEDMSVDMIRNKKNWHNNLLNCSFLVEK